MKKIVLTVLITLAVLTAAFFIYISSGAYDISQLSHHNALTKSIIRTTKHSSIDKRMKEVVVPGNLNDPELLATGFQHYNEMCVSCHGGPGVKPGEMAEGLYPKPPELYKHAEEDEAQEFFWIIKNGIKLTSMPAYEPTHDDAKIWAMTAFVTHKLPKMTSEEYRAWSEKYAEEKSAEMEGDSK